MSEEENSQTVEGQDNPMAAPCVGMIEKICVMLVADDKRFVTEMVDLLKSYDYKVTTVGTASTAMSMLSKGKKKIDVMIISAQSSNPLSFELLAQTVALDIISLFICDEHNELLEKKALGEGAYLCLQKPFDEKIVKYLWQFVLGEKLQREKARERSEKNGDQRNVDDTVEDNEEQPGEKKNVSNIKGQSSNIHETENDVVSNRKYEPGKKRGKKGTKHINEGDRQSIAINKVVRREACIKWTVDLHAKFMKVVQQLGEGRCFPKEILEGMNVSGLTRMQVASHLQKCRRNNWRVPKERKSIRHPLRQGSSSGSQQRNRFRKNGTMPHFQTNVSNLQYNSDQTQRGQEFSVSSLSTDSIFARGESSIQQQLCHPQFQIQPHNLSIGNPFDNPFLLSLNNVDGGIQQQHETFFEMLGSQGLQGPIIENTNYRPGLMFDSGDYHSQSNYNLNLDAAHGTIYSSRGTMFGTEVGNATVNNLNVNMDNVTTYSGSTMMSDAYLGNVAINGLGAPNVNFWQYIGEPNMFDPSNIIAASYERDIIGRDSNEKKSCDAYFDFNNMNNLFQNIGPPSANLPNEQDSEFNQVCSDDQVAATSSVQFSGITNYFD
ncbi:hypothetical protein HAX54_042366 [Datura stramonium]|uniref:Uncharacterized protein n=1 Tax=Datura stramonium TaxID=4076 RepID=A0ABS8VZ24_DATST|nr:hypothetical protein [Datura stramonium]